MSVRKQGGAEPAPPFRGGCPGVRRQDEDGRIVLLIFNSLGSDFVIGG